MTLTSWTVELEPGVWVARCDGDPGRTLRSQNAKQFVSCRAAARALAAARKYRPFADARVEQQPSGGSRGGA